MLQEGNGEHVSRIKRASDEELPIEPLNTTGIEHGKNKSPSLAERVRTLEDWRETIINPSVKKNDAKSSEKKLTTKKIFVYIILGFLLITVLYNAYLVFFMGYSL